MEKERRTREKNRVQDPEKRKKKKRLHQTKNIHDYNDKWIGNRMEDELERVGIDGWS